MRKSLFSGGLSSSQVNGLEAILDVWQQDYNTITTNQVAYCLATAYHETAQTMQPIEEYGKGRGHTYGVPSPKTGKTYYGRGYVQLTWYANYLLATNKLGVDFVNHPEKALDPSLAAQIMFEGMRDGWFTGKKLSDYIGKACDFKNARRIINGTDCADKIATYAVSFMLALKVSV